MAILNMIISGLVYFHRQGDTLWLFCMAPPIKPGGFAPGVHPHRTRLFFSSAINTSGHWPARRRFGAPEMGELVDDVRKPFGGRLWDKHFLELSRRDLSLEGFNSGSLDFSHQQDHRSFDKVASIGQFLLDRDVPAEIDPGLLAEPYGSARSIAARFKISGLEGQVSTLLLWGPHSQDAVFEPYISDYPPETRSFHQEMAHSVLITLHFNGEAMLKSHLQGSNNEESAAIHLSEQQGAAQNIFFITDYKKHHHPPVHQPDNNHFMAYYDLFQGIPADKRDALLRPRRSHPGIIGDSTCSPSQGP